MTSPPDAVTTDRDQLRSRLSLAPADRVVFAPGPSTRLAAHEDAVWVGSILRLIDDRFHILIWGRGNRVDRVVQRAAALKQPDTLCVAERRLGQRIEESALCAAADAALFIGADTQTSESIAQCQAARLPLIAVGRSPVFARLNEYPSAVILPEFSPPAVAEQILRLFDAKS